MRREQQPGNSWGFFPQLLEVFEQKEVLIPLEFGGDDGSIIS
jgi:hypothetical protein